jgi:L-histidine N-alpha-methyltransferase
LIAELLSPFAQDVAEGLTGTPQKTLPSSWLYDDVGSALFETITLLPEYGLTRADAALLRGAAPEIIRLAGEPDSIIELGSGTGTKTRYILEAASDRIGSQDRTIDYLPIDISGAALRQCAGVLSSIAGVHIEPVEARYLEGIERARHKRGGRALVLFLGSTIGNFSSDEAVHFLRSVRQRMNARDSLLLGADLVKPRQRLLLAYDDPLGVTAAFNLNLLARINRELGGEFRITSFAHEARFNEGLSRVEMHLRSRVAQKVGIAALGLSVSFKEGETIFTESSHKFRREDICAIGEQAGWKTVRQWVDNGWGFAETLFTA